MNRLYSAVYDSTYMFFKMEVGYSDTGGGIVIRGGGGGVMVLNVIG